MPNEPCRMCPALQAENNTLRRQVDRLAATLSELRASVAGQVRWIDGELEPGEATMPRDKALRRVRDRLAAAVNAAGGRA